MYTVGTIEVEDPSWFNILACPENNVNTRNYLKEQFTRLEGFSGAVKQFYQEGEAKFKQLCNSKSVELAKNTLRNSLGLFHPNTILSLSSLEALRHAQAVMQRYIMAEPTIRKLYHQQRCDGYSDTYKDLHPNDIADTHYDYQRVVNGIVRDIQDDDGVVRSYTEHYSDVETSDEEELGFDDQLRILDTWDVIRNFVLKGEDPTNVLGGDLG